MFVVFLESWELAGAILRFLREGHGAAATGAAAGKAAAANSGYLLIALMLLKGVSAGTWYFLAFLMLLKGVSAGTWYFLDFCAMFLTEIVKKL